MLVAGSSLSSRASPERRSVSYERCTELRPAAIDRNGRIRMARLSARPASSPAARHAIGQVAVRRHEAGDDAKHLDRHPAVGQMESRVGRHGETVSGLRIEFLQHVVIGRQHRPVPGQESIRRAQPPQPSVGGGALQGDVIGLDEAGDEIVDLRNGLMGACRFLQPPGDGAVRSRGAEVGGRAPLPARGSVTRSAASLLHLPDLPLERWLGAVDRVIADDAVLEDARIVRGDRAGVTPVAIQGVAAAGRRGAKCVE
ncbi:hypothetical protein LFADAHJC_LOCUS569 [Methylorubrum extorquens]